MKPSAILMCAAFAVSTSLLCTPHAALACGNHAHIAISLRAAEHLPDGPLKDLASDPTLQRMLVGGSFFPDGGYGIGHPYGETAHWGPYHRAFAAQLRKECPALPGNPATDAGKACRQKLAFLLGMVSHGLADELFDGLFMEASRQHDKATWSDGQLTSLDSLSDVWWAAKMGPSPRPELWLPMDTALAAYKPLGTKVSADNLTDGQTSVLNVALVWVAGVAKVPAKVDEAAKTYPWGTANLTDPSVDGSPLSIAPAVAAHWQHYWAELVDGRAAGLDAMAVLPSQGGAGVVSAGDDAESLIAVVFSRGLHDKQVKGGGVHVEILNADGTPGATVPIKVDVIYGMNGHALRLRPLTAWPTDAPLLVTVEAGAVTSFDGHTLAAPVTFSFQEGAPNAVLPGQPPPGWPLATKVGDKPEDKPADDPVDKPQKSDDSQNSADDEGGCAASRTTGSRRFTVPLLLAIVMLFLIRRQTPTQAASAPARARKRC